MTATTQGAGFAPASAEPPLGSAEPPPGSAEPPLGRGRVLGAIAMLGPAFVASVAYVDPGNFATNITCVITFGILRLQARGYRPFELAIAALLGLIVAGFLYETLRIGPSVPGSLRSLVPATDGAGSLYLAAGILGATVMPHAIYLHSALTKARTPSHDDRERGRLLKFAQVDVLTALGLAGLVNMGMLAVAARAFHTPALSGLATIGQAHTPNSASKPAASRRSRSRGRSLPPAPPPPASAPTRGRSSWPASSTCAYR